MTWPSLGPLSTWSDAILGLLGGGLRLPGQAAPGEGVGRLLQQEAVPLLVADKVVLGPAQAVEEEDLLVAAPAALAGVDQGGQLQHALPAGGQEAEAALFQRLGQRELLGAERRVVP